MPPFRKARKTEQNASQAVRDIESISRELASVKEDLKHTRNILEGLWELYKKDTKKSDADLASIVTQIEERNTNTPREAEKCPACSRALQGRSKACIYCGALVTSRRLF